MGFADFVLGFWKQLAVFEAWKKKDKIIAEPCPSIMLTTDSKPFELNGVKRQTPYPLCTPLLSSLFIQYSSLFLGSISYIYYSICIILP